MCSALQYCQNKCFAITTKFVISSDEMSNLCCSAFFLGRHTVLCRNILTWPALSVKLYIDKQSLSPGCCNAPLCVLLDSLLRGEPNHCPCNILDTRDAMRELNVASVYPIVSFDVIFLVQKKPSERHSLPSNCHVFSIVPPLKLTLLTALDCLTFRFSFSTTSYCHSTMYACYVCHIVSCYGQSQRFVVSSCDRCNFLSCGIFLFSR